MNTVLAPSSVPELVDAIKSTVRLLPVGARTKPRLTVAADTTLIDLRLLAGIIEYQPSEYTFTAQAGTSLREIAAMLRAKGQYLPFDPPLAAAGATLGGTVAANLSGPGRFRFGGVRDFILGLTWVDGQGHLIQGGGKVVKNAAGFDTPKLMVGSLGRLGVITQLTFKVFPLPPSTRSIALQFSNHANALARLASLAGSRFELDALDYRPADHTILLRLAGPAESNATLAAAIGGTTVPCESIWPDLNAFAWAPTDHTLIRIPTTPRTAAGLIESLEKISATHAHLTAGANLLWLSTPDAPAVDKVLSHLQTSGLVIRGQTPHLHVGLNPTSTIASALHHVFDPHEKFGARA